MDKVDYRKGNYRAVADRLRPAAELLVEWCAPQPGQLVVDVAAGSGNVARLCAARAARVVAVDRVQEQLLLGRADDDDDDAISWVVGDALALPLADDSADAALSTFGLIFADRPEQAVRELTRVCRQGGVVGVTAWPDDGFQHAARQAFQEVGGLAPGGHDHLAAWGTPERLGQRVGAVAADVEIRIGTLRTTFPSAADWWRSRATTPPVMTARDRLDDDGFAELTRRLQEAGRQFGTENEHGFVLEEAYLVARGRVP